MLENRIDSKRHYQDPTPNKRKEQPNKKEDKLKHDEIDSEKYRHKHS